MTRLILFRPEAEAETEQAYRWYEGGREGMGADFLLCVEEAPEKIRRDPELYPVVHKNVRRVLIRRFPFRSLLSF
jgi:toxin ParE1/3/4